MNIQDVDNLREETTRHNELCIDNVLANGNQTKIQRMLELAKHSIYLVDEIEECLKKQRFLYFQLCRLNMRR